MNRAGLSKSNASIKRSRGDLTVDIINGTEEGVCGGFDLSPRRMSTEVPVRRETPETTRGSTRLRNMAGSYSALSSLDARDPDVLSATHASCMGAVYRSTDVQRIRR
jgi:hypothetical protein